MKHDYTEYHLSPQGIALAAKDLTVHDCRHVNDEQISCQEKEAAHMSDILRSNVSV